MSPWLIAKIIAAMLLAILLAIAYKLSPFKQSAEELPPLQKGVLYFVVSYPLVIIVLLPIWGIESNITNIKHHILSVFVFITGHVLLSIMAMVISLYLTKRNKINIIFLLANSLATILYFTIIVTLLQWSCIN